MSASSTVAAVRESRKACEGATTLETVLTLTYIGLFLAAMLIIPCWMC